jgi:hypothetical protein
MSPYSICSRVTLHILVASCGTLVPYADGFSNPKTGKASAFLPPLCFASWTTYPPPMKVSHGNGSWNYFVLHSMLICLSPLPQNLSSSPPVLPPIRQHQEPTREFPPSLNLSTLLCIAPSYTLTEWLIEFPLRTRIFMFKPLLRTIS